MPPSQNVAACPRPSSTRGESRRTLVVAEVAHCGSVQRLTSEIVAPIPAPIAAPTPAPSAMIGPVREPPSHAVRHSAAPHIVPPAAPIMAPKATGCRPAQFRCGACCSWRSVAGRLAFARRAASRSIDWRSSLDGALEIVSPTASRRLKSAKDSVAAWADADVGTRMIVTIQVHSASVERKIVFNRTPLPG